MGSTGMHLPASGPEYGLIRALLASPLQGGWSGIWAHQGSSDDSDSVRASHWLLKSLSFPFFLFSRYLMLFVTARLFHSWSAAPPAQCVSSSCIFQGHSPALGHWAANRPALQPLPKMSGGFPTAIHARSFVSCFPHALCAQI